MSQFEHYINEFASEVYESSLSRIWRQVTKHDSGTISASRFARDCGDGERYTSDENKRRSVILESKLKVMGYSVTAIRGTYVENYGSSNEIEVKEQSYIVVDINDKGTLKYDLIKLGIMFDQDSITFSKINGDYYLISTNTCPKGHPGKGRIGVEQKLGKPFFGNKGEFHSKINGRPFVFEEVIWWGPQTIVEDHPTHIRSIVAFSKYEVPK